MRALFLRVLFVAGMVIAAIFVALPIFLRSLFRRARSFHPSGTICHAEVTALDDTVGPRLAGPALVRLSGATGDENSIAPTVLGLAIKLGGDQDLPLATFESFLKVADATRNTNIADYLANQFASVSPWHVRDLGIVWLRALPAPITPAEGNRVERLRAAIAAGEARLVLEARSAPGPDGPLVRKLAELRLVEVLPTDAPGFRISMFRTARGLVPTGFRNGIRAVVYPISQHARHLRGG